MDTSWVQTVPSMPQHRQRHTIRLLNMNTKHYQTRKRTKQTTLIVKGTYMTQSDVTYDACRFWALDYHIQLKHSMEVLKQTVINLPEFISNAVSNEDKKWMFSIFALFNNFSTCGYKRDRVPNCIHNRAKAAAKYLLISWHDTQQWPLNFVSHAQFAQPSWFSTLWRLSCADSQQSRETTHLTSLLLDILKLHSWVYETWQKCYRM